MDRGCTASVLGILLVGLAIPVSSRAIGRAAVNPSPDSGSAARVRLESTSDSPAFPLPYRFPTPKQQCLEWGLNAAGPSAIGGSGMSAAWGQWVTDEPPEWGGGGRGFWKRFGAGMATTAITETSLSLVSAAMRQDAAYYRSPRAGLGPRLGHALKMTVFARNRDGAAVFSPAKAFTPFAGPIATRTTLYPDRYDWRDGAVSGGCGVLMNAGWNVAKEFVMKSRAW